MNKRRISMNDITALIVTYNRLEKLKKTLYSYESQTMRPTRIILVDNCSTDGTIDFISEWEKKQSTIKKTVVRLEQNYGGSGGFYVGFKTALEIGFDWLWIADDDAYPDSDAFEMLSQSMMRYPNCAAFCSKVNTIDGIDYGHRKIIRNNRNILGVPAEDVLYERKSFEINIFSFVGTCLRKDVIEKCGLPQKDYFIWYDDTEYSLRVNKNFKIICIPSVNVFHDTRIEKEWKYSWKTYYGERNRLYTLKLHDSRNNFVLYEMKYIYHMIINYFVDYKYFRSQWSGFWDYLKRVKGVPKDHQPGKFKY